MADGISGLVTPYNTSEFREAVETARKFHHAANDQYATIAAELRRLLARIPGHRIGDIDSKIAARRVARHVAKAAASEVQAAQAFVRSYHLYLDLFTNKAKTSHSKSFDPDK